MAQSLASPATGTSSPPDDLIVIIKPMDLDFAEFIGTRAMLEAEGLIPKGTAWPQGYADLRWQAGRFKFWLNRQRPAGAKGLRSAFVDVDWFCLRQELAHGPSHAEREITQATKELEDVIYRRSARGQAEWSARWNRYFETRQDAAFQAFKATIPALAQRKRGRPAKNDSTTPTSVSHV